MSESQPPARRLIKQLFSDEWQMPIALSAGASLLIGYSLQVLVNEQTAAQWVDPFHAIGHALVWVSLGLGATWLGLLAGRALGAR